MTRATSHVFFSCEQLEMMQADTTSKNSLFLLCLYITGNNECCQRLPENEANIFNSLLLFFYLISVSISSPLHEFLHSISRIFLMQVIKRSSTSETHVALGRIAKTALKGKLFLFSLFPVPIPPPSSLSPPPLNKCAVLYQTLSQSSRMRKL